MGKFEIELYWKHSPNTCRNFAELARRGYYNQVKFHRIIKDFMIQGGDPTATGGEITDRNLLFPDSKVHAANMGPTWGQQDPGGPHMGHVNLASWVPVTKQNWD